MALQIEVTLTAPRFSSQPATVPTIQIYDVRRTPAAHREVMVAAHLLAAKIWTSNSAGRPISVEPTCDAGAQITVEMLGNTAAERDEVLAALRDAISEALPKRRQRISRAA